MTARWIPRNRMRIALAMILLYAAGLRLWLVVDLPPGLHADEASNVWNAWCLLKTGVDEWGNHWPIIAARAFNDYRSTSYLYPLLVTQILTGMSGRAAHLPAALASVACIALLYALARRLFDRNTALWSAGLMAVMPLSLVAARWAYEESLAPMLLTAALLAQIWAGWPLSDDVRPLRIGRIVIAGLITGATLYGYAALRVNLPVLGVALLIAHAPSFGTIVRTRRGRAALGAGIASTLAVAAPLIHRHLTDSLINGRANAIRRVQDSSAGESTRGVWRYASHFEPGFLFHQLNRAVALSGPAGFGAVQYFWLLPLLIGAFEMIRTLRRSRSMRTLFCLLICYPAASVLFGETDQPHTYYSNIGMLPLCLLAAVGCQAVLRWLDSYSRSARRWVIVTFAAAALTSHAWYVQAFYQWQNGIHQQLLCNRDLVIAFQQVGPRLNDYDAVFVSSGYLLPYELSLVYLPYEPRQWLVDPKRYEVPTSTMMQSLTCVRYGKMHFIYDREAALKEIAALPQGTHLLLLLSPLELPFAEGRQAAGVVTVGGLTELYIFDFRKP